MDSKTTTLFRELGGANMEGFPALHVDPRRTAEGTWYFQSAGVVLLSKPCVSLSGMEGFLEGFDSSLQFGDYLKDVDPLPSGTQLAKAAGQLCYVSFGPGRTRNDRAATYFHNIKSSGHGSVLEHASYSFLLYGVSRSFTHELVRHRAGTAFSQVSQRYVDNRVLRFVERKEYQQHSELHARFENSIDRAAREYELRAASLLAAQEQGDQLLSGEARTDLRKKVQQSARSCLPNEAEAPIVFTANVRALRHTIEMRASEHAETEIRDVFLRIFLCMSLVEPLLFDDYELEQLSDGTFGVVSPFRKV